MFIDIYTLVRISEGLEGLSLLPINYKNPKNVLFFSSFISIKDNNPPMFSKCIHQWIYT